MSGPAGELATGSDGLPQRTASRLRALTPARVGLGRTGVSQQTRDVLAFQLSHAQARDAVHARMDTASIAAGIRKAGAGKLEIITLHSAAADRNVYLQRPDLGRRLDEPSRSALAELELQACDLAVIVADGLSALAVERHVELLLSELLLRIPELRLAPICVVEQGRVAVGDEVGAMVSAALSLVLIGERPGLSSPDSLGAYLTWEPRVGRTDAERICISNIRVEGLSYGDAAAQIAAAIAAARQRQITGVALGKATSLLTPGEAQP